MNWIRNNSFIVTMISITLIIMAIIVLTDEKIEQYDSIQVEHGDSLWSIADQYRGKMDKLEWIAQVEKINDVKANNIKAGSTLHIPIEKNSIYFEQQLKEQQMVKVAKK